MNTNVAIPFAPKSLKRTPLPPLDPLASLDSEPGISPILKRAEDRLMDDIAAEVKRLSVPPPGTTTFTCQLQQEVIAPPFNPVAEIRGNFLCLTYGEMIEAAEGLGKLLGVESDCVAGCLHKWAKG